MCRAIGAPRRWDCETSLGSQCCDTWKQATSYWEIALSVLPFSDGAPLPAYTPPAMPPFSLNADPGAELAFPGSAGAVLLRQLWLG